MNIEKYSTVLSNEKEFDFFTHLLKAKIVGGLVSDDVDKKLLSIFEEIVDKRKIFDCPSCGTTLQINIKEITHQCDCGDLINTENIPFEKRYRMNNDFLRLLTEFFSQKFTHSNQDFMICFGEKKKQNFQHNRQLVIHITPFEVWKKNNITSITILDFAYVDHFLLSWDLFCKIIIPEELGGIFENILRLREETIKKQIDWKKIDEWDFEKMSLELLRKEERFYKIIPGGKGPDQGKDGFGYFSMEMPSGKKVEIKTLIQCKYTSNGKSLSFQDVQSYVSRAKQHNCKSLLFITNGVLSGDAISAIESDAFKDKDFYDVDFYDTDKLMNLLEKHDEVRIEYFFRPSVNDGNSYKSEIIK